MTEDYWQRFWAAYGPDDVSEESLFRQVGHTIGGQPIAPPVFAQMLDAIHSALQLTADDHLVDLCCGNGLFSCELAAHVRTLTGIDFAERNIRIARERKSRLNTTYVFGDVLGPLSEMIPSDRAPTKFLLHYALGYLTPGQLATLLQHIAEVAQHPYRFFLPGIPDADAKWKFYDTAERRQRHVRDSKLRPDAADGVGRWWHGEELEAICRHERVSLHLVRQPDALSNYRMDALITSER